MGIWNIVYLVVDNYCIYIKKKYILKSWKFEGPKWIFANKKFWPSRDHFLSSPGAWILHLLRLFFSISFLFGFAFFPSRSHPLSSPSSPPSAPSSPSRSSSSSSSSFRQKQKQQWRAAHSELNGPDFSASFGAKSGGIV